MQATDEVEIQRLTATLKDRVAASLEQWAIVEQARIRRMEEELAELISQRPATSGFPCVRARRMPTIALLLP